MPASAPLLPRLAVALLSLAVAAGCARTDADERAVVFWAMGSEAEAADAVLAGFREQHPEIPIRVQRVPWSAAHEKLLTAFVGGSMPDVFQLGNTWVAELDALGALEPLDARVEASETVGRDDFFAGALAANVVGGRLVALPWYVDTRLLFFRRDLLREAGVSAPPVTWAEWKTAMERVRRGEPDPRYGVFLPIDEWQTPVVLALQQGATLLVDNETRGNFRSDEVRRAFGFYVSLYADGLAPARSEAQIANLYREFAAGYFAYFVTGPWNLAELARRMPPELSDAWATAPMPAPDAPGPGLSIAGGASLAISSSSPRKDAAWALVEYLSTPAVEREFRAASGDLPPRRSAWDADAAEAGTAAQATETHARAFRAQLDHLAATPKIPEWERIADKITLHLERVVRGETDLDSALADLDADTDRILAKRRTLLAAKESAR